MLKCSLRMIKRTILKSQHLKVILRMINNHKYLKKKEGIIHVSQEENITTKKDKQNMREYVAQVKGYIEKIDLVFYFHWIKRQLN